MFREDRTAFTRKFVYIYDGFLGRFLSALERIMFKNKFQAANTAKVPPIDFDSSGQLGLIISSITRLSANCFFFQKFGTKVTK